MLVHIHYSTVMISEVLPKYYGNIPQYLPGLNAGRPSFRVTWKSRYNLLADGQAGESCNACGACDSPKCAHHLGD